MPRQQGCQAFGLHGPLGLPGDTYVQWAEGACWQRRRLPRESGPRRDCQPVSLTQQARCGAVKLIADGSAHQQHPCDWAWAWPAAAQAWCRGRQRFWIEPPCRDGKRAGFDRAHSQMADPDRRQRLILALAVTPWWLIPLGDWLSGRGHDRPRERRYDPDASRVRWGRDSVRRGLFRPWAMPVGCTGAYQ